MMKFNEKEKLESVQGAQGGRTLEYRRCEGKGL